MAKLFNLDSSEIISTSPPNLLPLICPICKEDLARLDLEKCFRCSNSHSFDISKQGYLNLLINSQKNSKQPGDSKEMVQARRDFLSKGYYEELSRRLNQFILKELENSVLNSSCGQSLAIDSYGQTSSISILDIGCGEGYYTNELMRLTQENNIPASFVGLDISRDAIKFATSTNKEIFWTVGNSHYLPLKDSSVGCALSVFSPVKISEVIRILKDDGVFIRVLPGVNHLIQIRNIIYPNVILSEEKDLTFEYEGLELKDKIKVMYDISLDNESILSLVKMTPHYWKTSKADKETLKEFESLTVTIDMNIRAYFK